MSKRSVMTKTFERQNSKSLQISPSSKKLLEYFRRATRQDSALNLHSMIQTGMIHHLKNRMHGTRFRIVGPVHQTPETRMDRRSRAHGAGLNCSKQLAGDQAVITCIFSRLAQG